MILFLSLGTFLSFLIGNTYRISPVSPQIRISFLDGLVVLIYVIWLLKSHSAGFRRLFSEKNFWYFAIFALISLLISTSFGLRAQFIGILYWFRFVGYSLLFIPLRTLYSPTSSRFLLWWVITACLMSSWIQYFWFPDLRPLAQFAWDPHYFRIVGSLLDPGFTGLLLVFILFYMAYFPPKSYALSTLTWALAFFALVFTYSRSSYLAFIVAVAHYSYTHGTWKYFILSTFLLFLSVSILPRYPSGEGVRLERTSSIFARLDSWKNGWQIYSRHPIFGVGFNLIRYESLRLGQITTSGWEVSHAGAGIDSSLIFIAATTGTLGLLFYLRYFYHMYHAGSPWLKTTLIAVFFHSFFLNSLMYSYVLFWLSLVLTLSKADIPPALPGKSGYRLYPPLQL